MERPIDVIENKQVSTPTKKLSQNISIPTQGSVCSTKVDHDLFTSKRDFSCLTKRASRASTSNAEEEAAFDERMQAVEIAVLTPKRAKTGTMHEDAMRSYVHAAEATITDPGVVPKHQRSFVLGVCGGTASGKTTVCKLLEDNLKDDRVAFIPSDCFYKELTPEQRLQASNGCYDFDHPRAIDWEPLIEVLTLLRNGQPAELPTYDFTTHSRLKKTVVVPPADVIIVEGILIFAADEKLRDMMDLKIFVDCDSDVRLSRRLARDIAERGREISSVLIQYMKYVKPAFEQWVEPSKRHADLVIPNFGPQINMVGVNLILEHIKIQLDVRRPGEETGSEKSRRTGGSDREESDDNKMSTRSSEKSDALMEG